MILEGFGIAPTEGNAIAAAKHPNMDKIFAENPHTQIGASGMDVGLPDGQMGNSEVGHTNIGAGRIVYQELTRITKSAQDGDMDKNCCPTAACTATTPISTLCWKWPSAWAWRRCSSTALWTAATCPLPAARTTSRN